MVVKPPLFLLAFVLSVAVAAAAVGVLLWPGEKRDEGHREGEMPSGLTGTVVTDPTPHAPVALVTPTARPELPSPAVDTSRAVPAGQTTLLEVDTGRVLRWENGENMQNARFSPDSRWLVFNAGWVPGENDLANSRIYRIDLAAPELTPYLIGAGFNPSISSRGDIAFNRQIDGQRAIVYVATTDGTIRQTRGIGATFTAPSWSPDGRWLVYASGYIGEGIDMPVTLVDTNTWTERTVDHIPNCPCDSGYEAQWSPDSEFFASTKGPSVISTAAGVEVPVESVSIWIRENAVQVQVAPPKVLRQIVTIPATPQNRQNTSDVVLQDPATQTETLLLTGVVGSCLRWSPDFRWLVADDFCDTI